jgi:hypothetical protein
LLGDCQPILRKQRCQRSIDRLAQANDKQNRVKTIGSVMVEWPRQANHKVRGTTTVMAVNTWGQFRPSRVTR